MFIFNDQAALYRSIKHNFMGLDQGRSEVGCVVFYMTGTPPTSYNALPFDTKDPYEVSRQCVGTDHIRLSADDALQRFKLDDVLFRVDGKKYNLFKQHFFDSTRSMWRVMPQSVLMERAIEEYDPASTSSVDGLYSDITLFPKVFYADTDVYAPGNTDSQFYMNRSRYPYAWPHIAEFDQVVTLDRIALMQTHSGSNYDNTGMTIEHWDPALNEGAGGWTNVQSVSYGGGNTQNEIDLTGRGLTSNKFRIKGNDTGSQPWVGKYFAFYTSTEPTITPFDVTWALIGPSTGKSVSVFGSSFNFDAVLEDNGYAQPEFPFMLASVGSPQTEGLLVLSQAENISDKTIIDTRLFTLAINNTES